MITAIARREFANLFLSPLAWVILGVVQFIMSWIFLAQIDNFLLLRPQLMQLENRPGVTDIVIAPVFSLAAIILLMVMPLITMRSLAEEKRSGSIQLLLSAPLSLTQLVLGKFGGLLLFVLTLSSLLMLMPLSLLLGTDLDLGKLGGIWLAMVLLLAAFSAVGLYLSSLTTNPTIAAVGSFGALLMLWIIEWGSDHPLFRYLSMLNHHRRLLEGVFDSADVFYFLLVTGLFLALTVRQLDSERLPR
jgi:ABC-2 type transport system permease protein